MAENTNALYRPPDPADVAQMLRGLEAAKGKKGNSHFQTKKSTFDVQGSFLKVDSWKMLEWDYKKPNLPTYARGLFTTKTSLGEPEIAIRGYDKFFNQGETTETEWDNIVQNTRGPYELSVKENGCIIFMSGLPDGGTLLVCSKHSTGSRDDVDVSHADWGTKWVDRHLQKIGKTRQELARTLRNMNVTAVAELCDDEFEEHVLEYTPESAGLYLHGLNLNLPEFVTYPHSLVDQFAEEWGFRKTQYIVKDTIHEVRSFLEGLADSGAYDGRDTEGFVIRCQSKYKTGEWHDWFFKFKFEEPYLMYRQWRECTKQIIAGKDPRYKKHKQITEEYLDFARRKLHGNKELAQAYSQNHGIIKLREEFLASRGLTGAGIIRDEQESETQLPGGTVRNVVFVPVATIGCGKTTLANTLVNLFGWGHVQNDNITVKKGKPAVFARACAAALEDAPAVIADRNSSEKRERKQIIEDVKVIVPGAKFVCLHYRHDMVNYETIRTTTRQRVLARGDNHQTIHAATKNQAEIGGIMDNFLKRFQPVDHDVLPDADFDTVIDIDPLASTKENVDTILTRLYEDYPGLFEGQPRPSDEEVDRAIYSATNDLKIEVKHTIKSSKDRNDRGDRAIANASQQNGGPKEQRVEYYGIMLPATQVKNVLQNLLSDAPPEISKMYNSLRAQRRIQPEFHVTLIHRASVLTSQENKDIWGQLKDKYDAATASTPGLRDPKLGLCTVQLERLVWDDRIMAFVVRLIPTADSDMLWRTANKMAHVTVGTANSTIKPVESNDLLERWLAGGDSGIQDLVVPGAPELEGVVRAVMSRSNGTNVRP